MMKSPLISDHSLLAFRKGIEMYVNFDEGEWEAFKQHLELRILKKKDHFVVCGRVCDHMGYIINGSVRYYHVKDGTEITGYFSFENDFISSYKSFVRRIPGTVYIQALEETELLLISHENMQLMLENPLLAYKMERFGRLIAEYYICCYEDRISSFILQSPEERYLQMLQNEPSVMQRVPQHYLANFLGITPVSLSRIRKRTVLQS